MKAAILTVGDELLIGDIVNGNAAWLGRRLGEEGVDAALQLTVGDTESDICRALDWCLDEMGCEVVIMTGGLGPTDDDRTRPALAHYFGRPLTFSPELFETIRKRFIARDRPLPPTNHRLAEVPQGFAVIDNERGTAPGLWFETNGAFVAVLPGVPHEMQSMVETGLVPLLQARANGEAVVHRSLMTCGLGESDLADRFGDLGEVLGDGLSLASLPSNGVVRLRVSGRGPSRDSVERQVQSAIEHLRRRLGDLVYADGVEEIEVSAGRMLKEAGLTLAVAESCTGGALMARLVAVEGASAYMNGGIVAYGNRVKVTHIGVDADLLEREGAVSEAVARRMAEQIRARLSSHVGLAVTGVAGPGGGTLEKPVGTVWLAFADQDSTYARRLMLTPHRAVNIGLATTFAINLLRRQLARKKR
ncbi:competence/damage-inducible protein A [soil metagenome]